MADNKMLIDAAHPEETRVAMVRGNRVDEFDFESEHKTQLRGNIYLAKVTRVEPSLQAAFVDYGGNRHGFLAFSEIHPDYYQIPIADRQALLAEEEEEVRNAAEEEAAYDDADSEESDASESAAQDDAQEEEDEKPKRRRRRSTRSKKAVSDDEPESDDETGDVDSEPVDEARTKKPQSDSDAEENDDSEDEIGADNESDDVVSEPVKKPRKRTSRAKKKDSDATGEETATADEDTSEEKPKPKRATSRAKKAKTGDPDAKTAEEKVEQPEAEAEVAAEAEQKPKPRSTRRKKAPVAKENADEAVSEASEDSTEPEASSEEAEPSEDNSKGDEGAGVKKSRSRGRGKSRRGKKAKDEAAEEDNGDSDENDSSVEEVGSDDALEEVPTRRGSRRHYKIQEVIKRRQILLVQVVKEERGNKGAALTTYLSLAGRYSVLMPNTARGGGISRKITNAADRKRLKSIASDLDVPQGMGVILRTAGAARKPEEIQRDFEYLMRLWESVRTLTLESTAPCLVYEEGSLIKRSIRDLYDTDTKEILVAGEAGHAEAKDFMSMLMPEHAKKVKLYKGRVPLFAKMGVETQLDAMLQPQVTLKSGGYIIIDQTEALVSIDVNSGKSTRQHSVEETATKTNLEAADEVARQLRLRDLAGLIVIDFIDMDEKRNNRAVEKRLKEALKHDRARIQVGRISHFGLLEMSRQRIRASVLESTTQVCPTCEGLGHVRSPSSVALAVLRAIEEHLNRSAKNDLTVNVSTHTALYLLNNKRENLSDLEQRFGVSLTIAADNTIGNVPCTIEKGGQASRKVAEDTAVQPDTIDPAENGSVTAADEEVNEQSDDAPRKKRRRRRRGKGASGSDDAPDTGESEPSTDEEQAEVRQEEAKSTKPPRIKRSRRNKPNAESAEEVVSETNTANGVSSSDNGSDGEEAVAEHEADKKPRRSTRRKKAPIAEKPAEESAAAENNKPQAEPPAATRSKAVAAKVEEMPKRETRRKRAPIVESPPVAEVEPQDIQGKGEPLSDETPDVSNAVQRGAEVGDKSDAAEKKKGGWWQRKFF